MKLIITIASFILLTFSYSLSLAADIVVTGTRLNDCQKDMWCTEGTADDLMPLPTIEINMFDAQATLDFMEGGYNVELCESSETDTGYDFCDNLIDPNKPIKNNDESDQIVLNALEKLQNATDSEKEYLLGILDEIKVLEEAIQNLQFLGADPTIAVNKVEVLYNELAFFLDIRG